MNTIKRMLHIVLFLLTLPIAAQESIERIFPEYGDSPIIKQYSNDTSWIVYSNTSTYCDFLKVKDGMDTVRIIHLPNDFISVSDFEIYSGTVYFCGMKQGDVPCLGYFNITSMSSPNPTINYIDLSNLKRLKKLEVLTDSSKLHVIIVGETEHSGMIVDAILVYSYNGWNLQFSPFHLTGSSDGYRCDDIAVIDDYVVVSTHLYLNPIIDSITPPLPPINTTHLWYFRRPLSPWVHLNTSSIVRIGIPFHAKIEACEGNYFVIAGNEEPGHPYVIGYNAFNCIGKVRINRRRTQVVDLSYSPDCKTTELILNPIESLAGGNEVITLQPLMLTHHISAEGHHFPNHILKSIEYHKYKSAHYVCVGDSIGDYYNLFMYRYLYNTPIECSERVTEDTTPYSGSTTQTNDEFGSITRYYIAKKIDAIYKEVLIRTSCESTID